MKRVFDLLLAGVAGVLCLLPILVIAVFVRMTSRGPVLYWSDRIGRNNVLFKMPKFRTMRVEAPAVATRAYG